MKETVKTTLKKVAGIVIIILGLIILLTPLTPGSGIIFIGLELLGIRLAFWQKLKAKWQSKSTK